jgi:hypothetical protein
MSNDTIAETLHGITRDVGEVIATLHYGRGQPVTFLEGSQIERCYDTLSDVSIRLRKAIARAEALPEMLPVLEQTLAALNQAPRFRIPGLELDSYGVAALCERVIAKAKAAAS